MTKAARSTIKSQAAPNNPPSQIPSIESILLGVIAMLITQTFRAGYHPQLWIVRVETVIYLLIPIGILAWLIRHQTSSSVRTNLVYKYQLQLGAILFALLPLGIQILARTLGSGDANEVVALVMIQNAAWYLTMLAMFWQFGRVGFVLSCAVVMFVCFTTNDWRIYGFALLYSLIAMWWLMGNYWTRLDRKILDGTTKTLPVRWSFLVIVAALVGLIGGIAWNVHPNNQVISLDGFMPTSGGNDWSDSHANSGVGDGDMLTGGDDATTTGAVESDIFIEDNKPSVYDAISDLFEPPVDMKKRKKSRAINIWDKTKHLHNVKQSEQAGKSFRTVRKQGKKRERPRDFESIISKALFQVEGSVPVRFKVNTLNHFDGWDWSNRDVEWSENLNYGFDVRTIGSKPWYVLQNQNRNYLTASREHRVKIMRLGEQSLLSPSFLKRWHIFKMDLKRMFHWGDAGVMHYESEMPPQTVIDMVSDVPNFHRLRSSNNFTNSFTSNSNSFLNWLDQKIGIVHHMNMSTGREFQTQRDSNSQFIQVPEDETKQRLRDLADQWIEGVEPGWKQVEEIVDHMRSEYTFDPAIVADEDCENAVGSFLDKKAGPVYLFATTAAQMLRAAGYKTRLAEGYLLQKEDYIHQAGQSIATNDNVHIWPEVCLDGAHWIPIEPTPGFPMPFHHETLLQLVKRKAADALAWMLAHPFISITLLALTIAVIRLRDRLIAAMHWLAWWLVFNFNSKRRLAITRRLIDARFRAAGMARPKSALISQWFRQVDQSAGKNFFRLWQNANFSSSKLEYASAQISRSCKTMVQELNYQKIRQYARNNNQKVR